IEAIEVTWPSGGVDRHQGLQVDTGYLIREGDDKPSLLNGFSKSAPQARVIPPEPAAGGHSNGQDCSRRRRRPPILENASSALDLVRDEPIALEPRPPPASSADSASARACCGIAGEAPGRSARRHGWSAQTGRTARHKALRARHRCEYSAFPRRSATASALWLPAHAPGL